MKGYLLDTSVVLQATAVPERLTPKARAAVKKGPVFLSVISYWEVMVKTMRGSLDVGDPREWWRETMDALGLQPMLFRPEHIAEIYRLPPIHQDPFDRALIAQATVEGLTLVTTDSEIPKYGSERFQAIR